MHQQRERKIQNLVGFDLADFGNCSHCSYAKTTVIHVGAGQISR